MIFGLEQGEFSVGETHLIHKPEKNQIYIFYDRYMNCIISLPVNLKILYNQVFQLLFMQKNDFQIQNIQMQINHTSNVPKSK